jgi:transposase
MEVTRVGLDIAKQVFQAHGVDAHGVPSVRRRLARAKVVEFFVQLPTGQVAPALIRLRHQLWSRLENGLY